MSLHRKDPEDENQLKTSSSERWEHQGNSGCLAIDNHSWRWAINRREILYVPVARKAAI